MEWDKGDKSRFGKVMRVRVSMDVGKPLKRGMFIKMGKGIQRKIFFKYKRLGNFCYTCGGLDHVLKECELIEEGNNEEGEVNMTFRV